MNIFFLKEEEHEIKKLFNFENYNFISASNLRELSCDILFVLDKSKLKYFIRGEINNNILETINIDYIVINDMKIFNLIKDNFDKIIDTKIEESYISGEKNKNLYRFFRIGENKLYSIVKNFKNFYYIEDPQGQHTSIDGKKCRKCTDYFLDGVNHYEKDINLMTRYSLEKVKYNKIRVGKNYRVVNFDIETLASVDAVNTPEPLIAIAAHDNFTNELKYWEIKEADENKEKEMLEDFFKYVSKFDIISGFNITKFDIPYLINRAIKVGADTSLITGIKNSFPSCKYRGKEEISPWFNVIPGISIVDLMGLAEKSIGYLDVKLPDKKLDTLGKYILGESKVEVATPAILFRTKEFEKLKEYTLQDVNIAVKLDEKLGLIELLLATIEIVPGINIDAAVWNSKIIDFYLLSKFSNIVMPSVVKGREKNIKGATVFETISGIHDNVGVFDVAGMYPALIRTFNISPDTKDKDGDIILDKTKFISAKKGILTKLVDDFTELRSYYKKQKKLHEKDKDYKLWQLKEFTVKKILASTYGVFGYVNFRFFDNDIANAITFAGRELLEHMKKISELEGCLVISGDSVDKNTKIKIAEVDDYRDGWFIVNGERKHFNNIQREITIEELFKIYEKNNISTNEKEIIDLSKFNIYSKCLGKNNHISSALVNKIIRHKTNKKRFKITTASGKSVVVTEDHSCIIRRNGKKMIVKPRNINIDTDEVYDDCKIGYRVSEKISKKISEANKGKIPWNIGLKPKEFMKYKYKSWLERKQDFNKMTLEESKANKILKDYGFKFNVVYRCPKKINGSLHYRLDFANLEKKIIFEIDGSEHRLRKKVIKKDIIRDNYFKNLGFKIYRINRNKVEEEINSIIKKWIK